MKSHSPFDDGHDGIGRMDLVLRTSDRSQRLGGGNRGAMAGAAELQAGDAGKRDSSREKPLSTLERRRLQKRQDSAKETMAVKRQVCLSCVS